VYVRRWSIEPLIADPLNTLVIQVLVTPHREREARRRIWLRPGEVLLITARTRKTT
jgi:hypothetical protein